MTRSECEIQALNWLGVPSFRNITKEMIVELFSSVGQMDPSVAKAALEQILHMTGSVAEVCGGAAETAKKAIESNGDMQKGCHETTAKVISVAKAIACSPDSSPEIRMEALKMIDRAAEREERSAEATRKNNERITGYIVTSIIAVVGILLAPIVSTRVRVPKAA